MHWYRKIIGSVLLILTLGIVGVSIPKVGFASVQASLNVSPNSLQAVSLGQSFSIQVKAYYVFNITGFQFQLCFNTTLLHLMNASLGSSFPAPPNSTVTISTDNVQGIVSVQAHIQGAGTPVSGIGTLLTVNFNSTYATQYPQPLDSCTLSIVNDALYGLEDQPIQHSIINGTYVAPYAPPQLNLTLNMNKNTYYYENIININGTLTGNDYPIPDALIALEIQGPNGALVAARTFETSSLPLSCPIRVTAVTPCDSGGTPQNSFSVESIAYFQVDIDNTASTSQTGIVIVNPYDASNATLGANFLQISMPPGGNTSAVLGFPLQYDPSPLVLTPPSSGNATVYVSVWSNLIEYGGTPSSQEAEAGFIILPTGTTQGVGTITGLPAQGNYQTSFMLHFSEGIYSSTQPPDYAVRASATYLGTSVNTTRQTQITIAGDINHDGKVDLIDLVYLANAYGTTPASGGTPGAPHAWNPAADINGNGKVDLVDLVILAVNYRKGPV